MTQDRFDDAPNLAIFCDFENVAIGVRDARPRPPDDPRQHPGLVIDEHGDRGHAFGIVDHGRNLNQRHAGIGHPSGFMLMLRPQDHFVMCRA